MKLTIVGSGTAAPEPERVCSGYLVEHGATRLLLDCGPGVVHGMARLGVDWPALDHVFITHFHNDHTGDLPMLLFALRHGLRTPRTAPLSIWGPRGLRSRLKAMEAAFGSHVADPGFPLVIREVAPDDELAVGGVVVRVGSTPHTPESVCYRLTAEHGVVGYTGDTGPSAEVAAFLTDVDVLVAECSIPDSAEMDSHLTPSDLASMATAAAPGRLVVTHVYPVLDEQDVVARVREAGWTGEAVRAADGLVVDVDASAGRD